MKILQVIPFFSPEFGGSVTSTFLTCQKLSERGHTITILTTDFHFDSFYAQKLKNVEVIPIECLCHIGLFFYSPRMKKWLSDNLSKYDIIHLQNFRSYQNALVSFYAKKHQIPYILQAHGSVLPFFEKQLLKQAFDKMWGNKIFQNASKCIALTKTELDQYIKMGVPEEKIVIIPNGLDLFQFSNLPEKGIFRKKYGISDNEQIILFLGRIHKIKGIDLLIDAYSQVLKDLPHASLVIAGPDDGYLSTIKEQIQRLNLNTKALITGPLYGRNKLEAYVDADVYVLPSRYDAFPNTVLEAWACGTPVVVATGCLIADLVEKAGCVTLLEANEIKFAILSTFTNEIQRNNRVDSGLKFISEEFDLELCITKLENIYIETIKLFNMESLKKRI